MKKVKLGEVCEIVTGSTPKSTNPDYWNGEYKWITPAEISDDDFIIVDTQRKISKLGIEKTGLKSFPIGTVLLSSRAPIGKVAIAGCEMYCNQGFKNFICSNEINNEYLYYFLKSRKNFLNNIGRGATFKEISKSIISNIEIILPSYNVQCTQTQNLKEIDNLIYLRKKVIKEYQLLVKSRFNEMFGDDSNFEKVLLSSVCDVRDGTHDSPKYVKKGFPLITSKNVTNGVIDFNNTNYISQLDFEKINQRSKVDYGDILLPMIGTIGNPVVVDTRKMFAIKNVALIKFYNESTVHNIYIKNLLTSFYFDKQVLQKIRGGTQKFIALRDIRGFQIPLPPLSLQNEFAEFVAQVDKSQLAIQKSLEELETLKKSLMQEYFN
ncbi:restriction endonuclease subunit S [Streptococcus infantis]|uniref:restriction endonuclease subunit S n=1 Tax=Streptococcus infantis TaxID=68892 RepID=UPI0039C3A3AA